ncbi:MAG: phenylacetate--CoA ligase family protein, partial [Pseudomonadota bacterium]|nr:phenylacetate--CoA ligase family protein [Pseudomonadota bacterium]
MSRFFDELETRKPEAREEAYASALPQQVARAQALPGYGGSLSAVDAAAVTSVADLASLPVLRKSALVEAQSTSYPFGGLTTRAPSGFTHIFQSPGPIYEPGGGEHDWWRMGRFLNACGIGQGDIVQNCFGYHLTPAG